MVAYYGVLFSMVITYISTSTYANGVLHCPSKCSCNQQTLKCIDKRLSDFPDFRHLERSLITVDLSENDIEKVKMTNLFSVKLITLQYLHLNDNSIIDIEATAFSVLPNLQYLDLSNNLLGNIPAHSIQRNKKLEELNLSGNLFSSKTPELLSTSLKILDLSFSKISVFTENNLKGLPSLRVLYLNANNLKQMDYNIFVDIKLQHVDLSFNCWKCNCETIKLFDYLVKEKITHIEGSIQCMHPNKWYEDIYNSNGPMHNNKLCKKRISHSQHKDDHITFLPKESSTSKQIVQEVHNSIDVGTKTNLVELEEPFYMRFEIIIIILVTAIASAVVLTIIVKCFLNKPRDPQSHIYKELTDNGIIISKTPMNIDG